MIEAGQIPSFESWEPRSLRTWADVRDVVELTICFYLNPIPGQSYNIGGTYTCTIRQMLDYLLSISSRKDIRVEVDPQRLRPIDADLQVPDVSKFQNHTGWKSQIPFEQTMSDLLNYWRERIACGYSVLTR